MGAEERGTKARRHAKGLDRAVAALLAIAGGASALGDEPFTTRWPADATRVWIGPEHFANRLQDWRLHDGRLECVEGRPQWPVRTVHLLTRAVGRGEGVLHLRVRTGLVDAGSAPATSWTGFLVGAGGDHVDHRLTALVHHRPAEDGGLLAVMDGRGRVAFRDFSGGPASGGLWSIRGPLTPEDTPVLPPAIARGDGFGADATPPVELRLEAVPGDDGYDLTLTALDAETGALVSGATITGVAPSLVDGGLALVSHGGTDAGPRGWWFDGWTVGGSKVETHDDRVFGPVLGAMHTLSRGTLKMTAQLGPLGAGDRRSAELQTQSRDDGQWRTVATAAIVPMSWTCTFRVEGWDATWDVPYRIVYELREPDGPPTSHYRYGTVRAEPWHADPFVVAAFTGHKIYTGGLRWNANGIWFPHVDVVDPVGAHAPDFLFFSGDQVYESDLTPAERAPTDRAMLDYLYKWYRWCWAFGDLTRDVPAVCIPDDHDVYHGNLWGAGGRAARAREGVTAQDSGGYVMPPEFVNAVHRTQTSHLPDPPDPAPVLQSISVYTTTIDYAGVSFAVLADRQWKSSPTVLVPEGKVANGWFRNPDFDPAVSADVPDAVLLGARQLALLESWAADWSNDTWMKVVLSQTIFANVATIPADAPGGGVLPGLPVPEPGAYPDGYKIAADADSNGWPQSGRNRALRVMRRGLAVHIAGDQHLASTIQYGVDDWRDAGYALCVPSIANTWPRRWFPPTPGANRDPASPPYTGDFRDGFGNAMTVRAVANPVRTGRTPAALHDRAPGYGIVRLNRNTRDVTIEVWPRGVDPTARDAAMYDGWPITFNQRDADGRRPVGVLPEIQVTKLVDPVVQVARASDDAIVYTRRIRGAVFRPPVYAPGTYHVTVGEPGTAVAHDPRSASRAGRHRPHNHRRLHRRVNPPRPGGSDACRPCHPGRDRSSGHGPRHARDGHPSVSAGKDPDRLAWWRRARFGMFVHWGLYAIPAGTWNGETNHAEWIRDTAAIPVDEYARLVGQFDPDAFDAVAWVRLAKAV